MQIPIHPDDQHKATLTCHYGTFAYRRMPLGLCNALASFQRCMMAVFLEFIEEMLKYLWMTSPFMGKLLRIVWQTWLKFVQGVERLTWC
jgi:hypothetical protein